MAVIRHFARHASIRSLFATLNSMAVHVAAKLAHFSSDERTLTDDACDMFAIWSIFPEPHFHITLAYDANIFAQLPPTHVPVDLYKTSVHEEARQYGADLRLIVRTPEGKKEALFQAKVRDEIDGLRVRGAEAIEKLKAQLLMMRQMSDLAFLLIYVPSSFLGDGLLGVGSWEQGGRPLTVGGPTPKLGISLIHVDELLDQAGEWRSDPFVIDNGDGTFQHRTITLSKLFIDMLVCNVSQWQPDDKDPKQTLNPTSNPARITLDLGFSDPNNQWIGMMAELRRVAGILDQ